MDEENSTLARRQLGKALRDGRKALGLTLEQAGVSIQRSGSTIQRLEQGLRARVRELEVEALCRVYEFDDGKTAALLLLAAQGDELNWWWEYQELPASTVWIFVGLETSARTITTYEAEFVPGLLQIPAYTGAVMLAAYPEESPESRAQRIQHRMRRQMCITRRYDPATYNVIIRESVIRGTVGGSRVMAAQCKHLADMSTRPNVTLQILPLSTGFPLGMSGGPFVSFEFGVNRRGQAAERPVVIVETYRGVLYLTKRETVLKYQEGYDALQRNALDPVASRALLRQAAREYAT
ncbi:helix-turn-helix domain-containing protein [Nocardia sp. NPDC051570]|uniref:helix-turn-helix domain-containing protein n=1 Tax=Nocardia sp. NPDC051570 TaxID=3364324 RepID=UPI0037B72409